MKTVSLKCETANYSIAIGTNLLTKVGRLIPGSTKGRKALIVTNRVVGDLYLAKLKGSLRKSGYDVYDFKTPYGSERDKSEKVLASLWEKMGSIPLERGSLMVALGGGVIGDLAGFAAATYMRGIDVCQVPTTLLAQVDSAIGGKTAIDLPVAKNIIGAFHQPQAVVSDVSTLKSLAKTKAGRDHFRDSFSEVIKYGIIEDTVLFEFLEIHAKAVLPNLFKGKWGKRELNFLETVITRSTKVKAKVVSEDEFEKKGKRIMLNFGHTFAHGFEAASDYGLSHGAAVAIGMACAARLAVSLKIFSSRDAKRLFDLLETFGLATSVKGLRLNMPKVMNAIERDKKKKAGKVRFVLPIRIGKTVVRENIPMSKIKRAIVAP